MSTSADITLAFGDLRLAAHCGMIAHGDWLREFLEPDFRAVEGAGDCSVHILADAKQYADVLAAGAADDAPLLDCFALDSSVVRLPILERNGSATTVVDAPFDAIYVIEPDEARVRILTRPENLRVRASLLRVVREFGMNDLHRRGLFLHAAAVAIGDGGIAFAGHKAAGKTTLLTYLLSHGVGKYLSNDRVFVGDDDGVPVLRNMPTVISVRPGTLGLVDGFRERFLGSGFTTYLHTLAESRSFEGQAIPLNQFGNYFLSPAQYRHVLGAAQQTQAPCSALVFPVICGEVDTFALRELGLDEAFARIPEALLGSGGWRKGTDAFTIPSAGPAPDDAYLAVRVERFCRRVACYEVRLGLKAYADDALASAVVALARP